MSNCYQSKTKMKMKNPVINTLFLLVLLLSQVRARGTLEQRIIGGRPATAGQIPFAAAISITTADGNYFCGGTVVSNQWILTAGQCVNGAQLFTIQMGSNYLNSNESTAILASADIYVLHPDFDPLTLDNDIGLIMLRLPVTFSNYLRAIDFLPFEVLKDGATVQACGWGQISDQDSGVVESLHYVMVSALSNAECRITYGSQITDNMVCVGGYYNEGSCHGDSGSPLLQTASRGNEIVVGVASFISANGCESTDPSGYTRVYQYNDWIRTITGRT